MRPVLCACALLPLVAACNEAEPPPVAKSVPSSSPAAASASTSHATAETPKPAPPSAAQPAPSSPSAAASRAEAPEPTTQTLYAFKGKLEGGGEDVRLAFERTGARLEGMYLASSETGRLRGTMNDTHLVVTTWPSEREVLVDARMEEGTLAGTWTAHGASPRTFSATPLVLGTKEAELDEAYDGVLGSSIQIHASRKSTTRSTTAGVCPTRSAP